MEPVGKPGAPCSGKSGTPASLWATCTSMPAPYRSQLAAQSSNAPVWTTINASFNPRDPFFCPLAQYLPSYPPNKSKYEGHIQWSQDVFAYWHPTHSNTFEYLFSVASAGLTSDLPLLPSSQHFIDIFVPSLAGKVTAKCWHFWPPLVAGSI